MRTPSSLSLVNGNVGGPLTSTAARSFGLVGELEGADPPDGVDVPSGSPLNTVLGTTNVDVVFFWGGVF